MRKLTLVFLALLMFGVMVPSVGASHIVQGSAVFQVKCAWSHTSNNDPIVYPGVEGASHQHEFFGAKSVDHDVTVAEMQAGDTSCDEKTDGSPSTAQEAESSDDAGYWIPTLTYRSTDGQTYRVDPTLLDAYYWRGGKHGNLSSIPVGLKMIAGDPNATSANPQSTQRVRWKCTEDDGPGQGSNVNNIPVCSTGWSPTLTLEFPDCWDGVNLDSADHRSHVTYSTKARGASAFTCPSTHPVAMPLLQMTFHWFDFRNTGSYDGKTVIADSAELSSHGQYNAHGDFVNGWEPGRLKWLVTNCVNANRNCPDAGLQGGEQTLPAPYPVGT